MGCMKRYKDIVLEEIGYRVDNEHPLKENSHEITRLVLLTALYVITSFSTTVLAEVTRLRRNWLAKLGACRVGTAILGDDVEVSYLLRMRRQSSA
jgi:hypothetical protein